MAGFNPNRKKKTYSFNRSQPSKVVGTVVDGKVEYFDETLVAVDNPFYQLQQAVSQGVPPPLPPPPPAQYDENIINFSGTDTKSVSFDFTFAGSPYLTLEVLPASGYENIAFFTSNITTNGFTANLSAPFDGQVVYRALYTSGSFPVIISRYLVSTSFYYTASAGVLPASSADTFTATYAALYGGPPDHIFFTPYDDDNNGDADVALEETGSMQPTFTTVTYSAPVYNSIHYLAVKS